MTTRSIILCIQIESPRFEEKQCTKLIVLDKNDDKK